MKVTTYHDSRAGEQKGLPIALMVLGLFMTAFGLIMIGVAIGIAIAGVLQ